MIFCFAICFRRPRYRVFRYQSYFFYDGKDMFYLGSYRSFSRSRRLICARERVDAFFALGWTAVDLITNSLSLMIADNGMLSFFSAQIPAVAIYNRFFAGQKLRHHGHTVHVGAAALYRMNQSAILIYTDVGLVSKVPCIALFSRDVPPDLASFLGSLWKRVRKSAWSLLCFLFWQSSSLLQQSHHRKFRNRPKVSPSGTWLLDPTPQKSDAARLSTASATVPSSERLYRFCST